MVEKETSRLHKELVKLADLMETCDFGDSQYKEYNKEYRRVLKKLYPEMFATGRHMPRRPSYKIINSLKECDCGQEGFLFSRVPGKGVRFKCKKCERESAFCETGVLARDSWNKTFENQTKIDL